MSTTRVIMQIVNTCNECPFCGVCVEMGYRISYCEKTLENWKGSCRELARGPNNPDVVIEIPDWCPLPRS